MIEITYRNGYWEAYVGGALFDYAEDLETILKVLATHADELEKELKDQ
jgi:type III secretory pathway component EscU